MPILRERLETALPIEDVFAFVADFANASRWDPGVAMPAEVLAGARKRWPVTVVEEHLPFPYVGGVRPAFR